MSENMQNTRPRSPLMMNRHDTGLVVIDMQEKLAPLIQDNRLNIWNISRLIRGCDILNVPVLATEQYPVGLGETVPSLTVLLQKSKAPSLEKTMFSCRELSDEFQRMAKQGIQKLIISGIESHVCVLQSALDLMGQGFDVFVPIDAIGSRNTLDHETALCRLEASGATLVSTEMVLFELCESSDAAEFKQISQLVKEEIPASN